MSVATEQIQAFLSLLNVPGSANLTQVVDQVLGTATPSASSPPVEQGPTIAQLKDQLAKSEQKVKVLRESNALLLRLLQLQASA